MEYAGFQQCVAQLSHYMQKLPRSQRMIFDGLRPSGRQQPDAIQPACSHRHAHGEAENHLTAVSASEKREDSLQPRSCSTPSHENAFTPPSPWLSPSFSTFVSSPSSLSSPLSTDTSFFSVSPTSSHSGPAALSCPPATAPHPAPRGDPPPNPSAPVWRPWF